MTYDIHLYRAVALARIPEKGLGRTFMKRTIGRSAGGLPSEHGAVARTRMMLKSLMLALYATHGDLSQLPRIGPWMGLADGDSLPFPAVLMSTLEDDLRYVATDAVRPRCYFNLSVLRESQVTTDPDMFAAYYQFAMPERVAAICCAALSMPQRLTLHALFVMGGRRDIEMLADIACMDVALVVEMLRDFGRVGVIHRCQDTGLFEINYELLKMVDLEAEQ